jgi:hypothetical protein
MVVKNFLDKASLLRQCHIGGAAGGKEWDKNSRSKEERSTTTLYIEEGGGSCLLG